MKNYHTGHKDAGFFFHAAKKLCDDLKISSDFFKPSSDLSLRNASDLDKYCIFYPILNFDKSRWSSSNAINNLPPFVVDDINSNKAFLLIDFSNESGTDQLVNDIHQSLIDNNVRNVENVILLVQNRLLKYDARRVKIFNFDYFPLISSFFIKSILSTEYSDLLDIAITGKTPRKKILCLNATPRSHRLLACAMLQHHDLFQDSIVSFPGSVYGKGAEVNFSTFLGNLKLSKLSYLTQYAENILNDSPFIVDDFKEIGNHLINRIDNSHYLNTWMSLVTETNIDNNHQRVTEKTIKAFGMGHPAVIFGPPNSIQSLKEMGFSAFDNVINHDYDNIDIAHERLELLTIRIKEYLSSVSNGDKFVINETLAASRFNRKWISSGFSMFYFEHFLKPILSNIQDRFNTP